MMTILAVAAFGVCGGLGSGLLRGEVSWAGIEPHPAVVNPVVRPADDPDVVSLRGEWDFLTANFGSHRQPISAALYSLGRGAPWTDTNRVRRISVPGCWEAQGVGNVSTSRPWVCTWDCSQRPIRWGFWGEGWYRKSVTVPAGWRGKRIWLKTGIIGNTGFLWVNGQAVAHVTLYCGTVKYDVTDFVKPGEENVVVVQAINTGTSRLGGLTSMNSWGGILRDIEFEATPSGCFIDDAWVRGDFDGQRAEVKVKVEGEQRNDRLVLRATVEGEQRETDVRCSSSPSDFVLDVPLRDFRPWSPVHPNLYTAKVELVENGAVIQTRYERFGVRKLEVRGKEFYLNGRPFYVRGCGWHAIDPIRGTTPRDRGEILRQARKIRASGFNACRFHTSCREPEVFEAADEVGLLLQPELPYYNDVPASGQAFDPMGDAEELWRNYRRHPSFAVYSGGNEGWFGTKQSKAFYEAIKATDPDRLAICQDGWFNPESNQRGTADFQGGAMNVWPRGSIDPDMPFFCHEYLNLTIKADSRLADRFTGVWLPPVSRTDRRDWLARFGLDLTRGDRLQGAMAVLQKTWRKYGFESARLDPHCDGYSYWSLQDVCSRFKGACTGQALYDPFFGDKPCGDTPASVARYNSETCVLMDVSPRLYGPDEEAARFKRNPFEMYLTDFATNRVRTAGERIDAHFYLAHYGERDLPAARLVWKLVADGRTLASGEKAIGDQTVGAVREIATEDIAVPDVRTACHAVLEARVVAGTSSFENAWDWWLFPKRAKIDGRGVYVADAFRAALAPRFTELAAAAGEARVVIAPTNDPAVAVARAAGKRLVTISGTEGPVSVTLGWWWLGDQMGAVLEQAPELRYLPHDGVLSPLLFRIMKKGEELRAGSTPLVYGEGGEACYSYLRRTTHPSGCVEYAVTGMDLLADFAESDAILRGLVEEGK